MLNARCRAWRARVMCTLFPRRGPSATITLRGEEVTGSQLRTRLRNEMAETLEDFLAGRRIRSDTFRNDTGFTDGNQYGILFAPRGVAVFALPTSVDDIQGASRDVTLQDVSIGQIRGAYVEVPGLPLTSDSGLSQSYTDAKVQTGPVGDVFNYRKASSSTDGSYTGNVLSDAQIYLSHFGRGTISPEVRNWASGVGDPPSENYLQNNLDSMAHVSKGTIGLLLSAVRGCKMQRVQVSDIANLAEPSSLDISGREGTFQGANAIGMTIAASRPGDVRFRELKLTGVSSRSGLAVGVQLHTCAFCPYTKGRATRSLSCWIPYKIGGKHRGRPGGQKRKQ